MLEKNFDLEGDLDLNLLMGYVFAHFVAHVVAPNKILKTILKQNKIF